MEKDDSFVKMRINTAGATTEFQPGLSSPLSCRDNDDAIVDNEKDPPSFESVLTELGMPGRYQISQAVLFCLSMGITTSMILSFVFIGYEPPFTCNTVNETEIFTSLRIQNDSTAFISYGSCRLEILTNLSGSVEKVTDISCPSGRNFSGGSHTSILSEWDLVCESAGIAELIGLLYALGQIVGGLIGSAISDRFGRKPVFVISSVVLCVLEFLIVFAPNIFIIGALRFVNGMFQEALNCAGLVLIMELMTPPQRTLYGIAECVAWVFCTLFVGAIAYGTQDYGWRGFQTATALMGAIFPLYIFFAYESPRWLSVKGETRKALAVLKIASKQNKKDFGKVQAKYMKYAAVERHYNEEEKKKNMALNDTSGKRKFNAVIECFTQFCQQKIITITVISSFAWLTNDLIYYGMYMMSSTFSGDRFLNFSLMALTEIPSNLALFALMPRMGRRKIMAIFLGLASASLLVCSFIATFAVDTSVYETVSLVFFLVGKFAITASYNVIYIYTPEIFPTHIRTVGFGVCSSVGRIGSLLAPYVRPFYGVSTWGPVVTFCVMCVATLMLTPILPEMKDVNLQDTTEEMIQPDTKKQSKNNHCRTNTTTSML